MGYPPFNLTTLQLVAPTSNMTKAEYKDAYGIDLDEVNIKAFKLVLFGGEKYAIDQIKEVEDGIEIYFNGHIMSITDIVQVSDEVYDIVNSKPIYCHPLDIILGNTARIGCLIFNNSETPFTKNTFVAFIENLFEQIGDGCRIICTGVMFVEGTVYPVVGLLRRNGVSDQYSIYSQNSSGTAVVSTFNNADALISAISYINDEVNKIN